MNHHRTSRPDPPRHRADNPYNQYDSDGARNRFRGLSTRLLLLFGFLAAIVVLPTAVRAQDEAPQLASLPAAAAPEVATASLLINSDFSDQTGWISCAGAEESTWDIAEDHLRIVGSGPACVYQTVRAVENRSYQLRCESYEEAIEQQTLIRLSALGQDWQTLGEASNPVALGSSFTTLTMSAPAGTVHVGVTFDSPGVGYSSYGRCELTTTDTTDPGPTDDPDGSVNPPPPPEGTNLLLNGDFVAAAGWSSCDSASSQPTIDNQLIITASEAEPTCIFQEVSIDPADQGQTFELACISAVTSGYASLTVSALSADYSSLAAEVSEGATLGQPVSLTVPPGAVFLAVTFYGEGFSSHDNCVLAATNTNSNPEPPSGEVVITADEFAAYPWTNLEQGTVVNLVGNFQSGIVLTDEHSGLVFDGGHTINGADGWISGAVLDGTGYPTEINHPGAISIDGARGVTVQNFKIGNYRSQVIDSDPKGIYVLDGTENVTIKANEIFGFTAVHDSACHTDDLGLCGSSHGILVATWRNPARPINGVKVYDNHIHNMDLGKSEALTVVGDVRGFEVKFNWVYDSNNIGIDIAGFTGNGAFYSTSDGLVEGNTVYNVDTRGSEGFAGPVVPNQAYLSTATGLINQSAACIYVDGGRDVDVVANRVSRCNIGMSVNGERPRTEAAGSVSAQNVVFEGNLVYDSSTTGFKLGASSSESGGVEGCDIRNNAFYTNDATGPEPDVSHDGPGEIWIEQAVRNCVVRDNTFLANAIRPNAGPGGPKAVFANTFLEPGPETVAFTNNQFYYQGEPSNDTARCQWIGFTNLPMSECLSILDRSGTSPNSYGPIPRPPALELPTLRNY